MVSANKKRKKQESSDRGNVVDLVQTSPSPLPAQCSVLLGKLVALSANGEPRVDFSANESGEALPALATVALAASDVGHAVTLVFADGNPLRPIVSGVLRPAEPDKDKRQATVAIDGDRLLLSARREIVLTCGKASITLHKDGRLVLRGAHLLSRSSGPNRIKGGSIQLN